MSASPHRLRRAPARTGGPDPATSYLSNPASRFTAQGGDPDPADLGWCIRRCWRVIYYGHRHTAGLPLWSGAEDFERLMADVLRRLSRGFEPIAPLGVAKQAQPQDQPLDSRRERFRHSSCRVFLTPRFDRPGWDS